MTPVRAVLLPLGDEWRALHVSRVREVVAAPRATPLPAVPGTSGAPATVAGVFNLRGEIVPLFDLAALLGLAPAAPAAFAVVADTAAGPAGLATSALPETRELGEPIESDDADQPGWRVGDRLVRLLDLDALLATEPGGTGRASGVVSHG